MTIREQEERIAGLRKEALNAAEVRAEGPRIVGDSQASYRKHRPFRS
jgi:hypothetical protein